LGEAAIRFISQSIAFFIQFTAYESFIFEAIPVGCHTCHKLKPIPGLINKQSKK
jgi:hypothetical protein